MCIISKKEVERNGKGEGEAEVEIQVRRRGHIARRKDNRWTKRCTESQPRSGRRDRGRTERRWMGEFLYIASPQQGDLRLSGPPSGRGAGSGARTRDRMVPADLRADSQATVLPTPPGRWMDDIRKAAGPQWQRKAQDQRK
ncbi:endonuclease-reverse transcriptase [Plakobranchus ocellatus]|uniref:Endonuclease-reverse transcriptase n=1 Tax=Plakobranchus ocellatus TaxID=259542 RepID=A0AAV4DJF6_9GAST|nr:endonuclease-reverse transcriptase [Plakobranchus ocellatus]